jgi:hypothetical protein
MDGRPKPIELPERRQAEEEAFIAQLAAPERERVGKVNNWSAKDLIAHLAGWKLRMADQLAASGRGEATVQTEEIDAENALIWSECCDRSWEEVLQASSLGQRRLIDGLQALSLKDLHDANLTARLSWEPSRQPMIQSPEVRGLSHAVRGGASPVTIAAACLLAVEVCLNSGSRLGSLWLTRYTSLCQ